MKKSKTSTVDLGKKGSFKVKKGALHREMGIPEGEKIPESKLRSAMKKGGKLAARAKSAIGLRAMGKK